MSKITMENKRFTIISEKMNPNYRHAAFLKKSKFGKTIIVFNQNLAPFRFKVSHEFAEYWKLKQQAKHDLRAFYNKSVTDQLSVEVLMSVIYKGENKFWSGISTYWAGYARGIREHRHKVKETAQSAFDIIGADDVRELSHELGINEDKITSAVMEVISKRKNRGKA